MRQNKTVLEKLGMSKKILEQWKAKGLKISYPMRKRGRFFRSQDGEVFVESADKYVPPLTKNEVVLYTKSPEKFRKDYLANVRFYFKFHTFLFEKSKKVENLKTINDKVTATLALLYLFLSAMDHHHYHFDRYLVYEDYPETPVGYWWQRLKDLYYKAFREKVLKETPPQRFLQVLSEDKEIIKQFKSKLDEKDFQELRKTLKAIKIFEDAQQKEGEIISGFPAKEDLLLKTGFGIWNKICSLLREYPEVIDKGYYSKIRKLISGHPIVATRELLLIPYLKYFKREIFLEFEKEVKRWI